MIRSRKNKKVLRNLSEKSPLTNDLYMLLFAPESSAKGQNALRRTPAEKCVWHKESSKVVAPKCINL